MKVICINGGTNSPLASKIQDDVIEGNVYTIRKEIEGYSNYAKRHVHAYGFYEITGYYESSLFIPLSNIDELQLVNTNEELNFINQLKINYEAKYSK